jgi:hypothetical protein
LAPLRVVPSLHGDRSRQLRVADRDVHLDLVVAGWSIQAEVEVEVVEPLDDGADLA